MAQKQEKNDEHLDGCLQELSISMKRPPLSPCNRQEIEMVKKDKRVLEIFTVKWLYSGFGGSQ